MLRFLHSADWKIDRHLRGGRSGGFSEKEDTLLLAEAQQLQNALDHCKRKIDSGNSEIPQQSITRFTKGGVEISTLQIQLEMLEGQGLEETSSDMQRQLDHLKRNPNELKNCVKALDLLLNLLRRKRLIFTCQLQARLLKRLNHYLNLLILEAAVTVDEHLHREI